MPRKQPVGLIGLGIIGSRVAANLRRAGHEVWVWNRSPKAEPNFLTSPAEVAEAADILLFFVADGPALLDTIRRAAPALAARHLLVNCATIAPAEARAAAALAAESSAGFLEAPFTGSRDAAAAGQLVHYVAGPPEWLERARPVLDVSARAVFEIGAEIGQAALVKLATNLVAAAQIEALAEAMALLDSEGVSGAKFAEIYAAHGTRSPLGDMKLPSMIAGEFEPHFALKHMLKDVRLALGIAGGQGMELPATAAVAAALEAGLPLGWGDLDYSAVARKYAFPGREPAPVLAPASAPPPPAARPKRFPLFGSRP